MAPFNYFPGETGAVDGLGMKMTAPLALQNVFHKAVNSIYAVYPQPPPALERLRQGRIIAHRGIYDTQKVLENTLCAFDSAADSGIWGIEFDVRWTKDFVPVIFHDRNLMRLYGTGRAINQLKLAELKTAFPLIPTLGEVILRYGRKLHLMIEIKQDLFPDPARIRRVLKSLFSPLTPEVHFHVIALDPGLFRLVDFLPRGALLPIAEINVPKISELALKQKYRGILGHYLMITRACLEKHRRSNQIVGTGFVNSRNCLFRELNRGVDWIFSENALELQMLRERMLGGV